MSLLVVKDIHKRFGNTQALAGMSLDVRRGEVHALMGENGAGKSTLINLINGIFPADKGSISFDEVCMDSATPHQMRELGVSTVFQEFSLVPDMSVEDNLFLGLERSRAGLLKKGDMREDALRLMGEVGLSVAPDALVVDLSRAEQQMVEIAKALLVNAKLLILDEPTASLSEGEAIRLFEVIATLKARGVAILYVSHRMKEIRALADRITILRDGRDIATCTPETTTDRELIELMAGRKVEFFYPEIEHRPRETRLRVEGLTTARQSVKGVSLSVCGGEIVGIAGLAGCGKSEVLRAVFGLETVTAGQVELDGKPASNPEPVAMLRRGLCYFTSDRVAEGLFLNRPVRENMTASAIATKFFSRVIGLKLKEERQAASSCAQTLQIRSSALDVPVETLSGGNRQKALLARGFTRPTEVFLFDEPTVGIDVGAKAEIYQLIKTLVEDGAAVLMASSDLPEILHLSNRTYVMREGAIVASLEGDGMSEERVLHHFFAHE